MKHGDLYAIFAGGVQDFEDELMVITDSGSKFKNSPDVLADKAEEHNPRSARVIFWNPKTNEKEELHFNIGFQKASILYLKNFLERNVGI